MATSTGSSPFSLDDDRVAVDFRVASQGGQEIAQAALGRIDAHFEAKERGVVSITGVGQIAQRFSESAVVDKV